MDSASTILVQLRYDAKLPMRDVELEAGEVPPVGHPERDAYLSMQSETRSILGLLLWVSIAYPQIIMATNKGCGFMSNPSYGVNAFAKHIILNLVQNPTPVAVPKKSAWTRRKAEVLTESYESGEVAPEKCEDLVLDA